MIAVAAIGVAACAGDSTDSDATTLAPATPTTTGAVATVTTTPVSAAVEAVEVVDDVESTITAVPQPVEATTPAAITVDTGALPREVSDAIRRSGGELATTSAWVDRFAPVGLPLLDGPGVHLVEADVEVTGIANGWRRVDAMQWLYIDSTATGVAGTLDQLAGSIDVDGWDRLDDSAVVDAAPCITRTYTTPDSEESWILQGCDFPAYPAMVSIGVTHTTTPPATTEPPPIDPSVAQVVVDIDGTIEHVTARFGPPATVDSTATLTATVTVTPATGNAGPRLASAALAGWTESPGEANSTVFVGAPGQAWTVTPTTVRYSSQGRLAP